MYIVYTTFKSLLIAKTTMKTAVVNFKTTPEAKRRALENTKKAGIPLSLLLNQRLNEIASASNLTVNFGAEEPSEWLKQQLKESEEDRKASRIYSFKSIDDSMPFLKSLRNDS